MANYLKMLKRQQVLALLDLGWTYRRIEAETGVRREDADYLRRHWGGVLRSVNLAQRDVAAYVALSERTGLAAQDCQVIATMLVARRKPQDALDWVERGLGIEKETPQYGFAGYELAKLRRALLSKLGRGGEAPEPVRLRRPHEVRAQNPSELSGARTPWARSRARTSVLRSSCFSGPRSSNGSRISCVGRRTANSSVRATTSPDLAARLWRAQGMRIVDAKKSKYYDAALSNFERAKSFFCKAGLAAEWEKTVSNVRTRHRLKTGFMPDFEKLVAVSTPREKPSFLEWAKKRWGGLEKEIS